MTVTATNTLSQLLGNGSATAFPFTFAAASASEVDVYLNGVRQTGGYTTSLSGAGTGGTVLFDVAPANGVAVVLASAPAFTQASAFENNAAFRPDVFNRIHDRLTVYSLWLRDRVRLLFPAGPLLPDARAGKYLAFDASGEPVFTNGTGADSTLRTDLATSDGASLTGFLQAGTGAVARTAQSKFSDSISVMDFIPESEHAAIRSGTTAFNCTSAFAAALAAHDCIDIPKGTYLGSFNFAGLTGKTLRGAGSESTVLKNWDATAPLRFDNTSAPCQKHRISGLKLQNRNPVTFASTDAITFTGVDTNQQEFISFHDVQAQQFRRGLSIEARLIWASFYDCHLISNVDGIYCSTSQNVSRLSFIAGRIGSNTGYGVFTSKLGGDPFFAWQFVGTTVEQNGLCAFRSVGSIGHSGLSFIDAYMEENAGSIAAGSTSPRKANVSIEATDIIGLNVVGGCYFGNASSPLDWNIHISSNGQTAGFIGSVRTGVATLGFASLPSNFVVAPRAGNTNNLETAGNTYDLADVTVQTFPTPTLTLTGCTTSPTGLARGVRQGKQATLYIPLITGTSNATTMTLTGLPADLTPARVQRVPFIVQDASAGTVTGTALVEPSGVITLQADPGGGAFSNTGTKGVLAQTITYSLE